MLSTANYDAFDSKFQPTYNLSTGKYIIQYKTLAVQTFGKFTRSANLAENILANACAILHTICILWLRIFSELKTINQFHQNFPPPKFCIIGHNVSDQLSACT